jgi:SagB-type dehydrogenase family enzyme
MPPGRTARDYHRLTSVSPETLEPLVLDLPAFPAPCKVYPDGPPTVALPDEWDARAGLDLAALARILHLSAGVVRTSRRPDGRFYHFRAAGSAGGRSPYEVYVAARGVAGLDDGVHWYDPVGHALRRVGPPAGGEATALVVTGIPWRTGWQYAERGFRHIYWDAGSMLAQTLALAGPSARLFTRFPDAAVTRLVGADGVHEWPVALVALTPGAPAIDPGGDAVAGEVDTRPAREYPLVTRAQHAGDGDVLGGPWPDDPPAFAGLEDVILRRGSTRLMDPVPVSRELFAACLGAGLPGRHFVAVHAVDGVAPGLYEWPRLVRAGDLREALFHVCMEQALARDAAFVVMAVADLEALDDRGYREAQLAAGIGDGRIHLAAFAGGAGATGMTFYDSELEALLGEPLAGLLFTCVGVPAYRGKRGGPPRAPVPIGTMRPR